MSVKAGSNGVDELRACVKWIDELTELRRQPEGDASPVGPPLIWLPLQGGHSDLGWVTPSHIT